MSISADTGYKTVAVIATLSLLLLLGYLINRHSNFATRLIESLKGRSSTDEIVESSKPLSLPELVKKIKPSVVEITTYDAADNPDAVGSGFFTGPRQVVSNWHVVEGSYRAEIKTADGGVYPVRGILASDKEADLVMLEIDIVPNKVPALRISPTQPDEGEKVVVIGNPLGLEGTVSDGIVSAIRDVPKLGRMLQVTAPISPGSSGGPVVNMTGEVVGIARGALKEGQNLNFAVPGDQIAALQQGRLVSFAELHHQEAVGLYDQALQFAHNGSCNLAIPLFKQAVADDQDYEDAWLELGMCQIESSSYEDALDALKQVIRINPKSDKGYFQVARVSVELNLWDEALRLYRQAVAINPGNDEAQYGLGLALCKTGDIEAAQRTYHTLARLNPGRAHELYEVYPDMLTEPPPRDRGVEGTITLDIDPTTGQG
jgi:hypothetical protein